MAPMAEADQTDVAGGKKRGRPKTLSGNSQDTIAPIELRDMSSPIGVPIYNKLMNNAHVPYDISASADSLNTSKDNSQKGRPRFRLCAMYIYNRYLHRPCGR